MESNATRRAVSASADTVISEMLLSTTADVQLKAKLFRGFSDPSRLAIIEALRDGPLPVGAIVEVTRLSQPNTSNHLACLKDCGLVRREQRGRYVYYQLSDPRIPGILELAEGVLEEVARGVYACTRYGGPGA